MVRPVRGSSPPVNSPTPTGLQSLPQRSASQGDVRTLPAEQGGGWAVGPEDYSAAVLTVGSDGMLSWYLSPGQPTVTSVGCAVASGSATEPALGAPGVRDAVPPAETVPAEAVPGDTAPATDGVAPDVVAPDCPVPNPPVGVPTKDEALAKAKQLFADWGYDVSSFQFDDAYADEWGASVNASLVLDGLKAPVMLSVGFGENGTVTYASGYLATPARGADYPTIGAAAGLERLKTQNQFVGGWIDGTGVLKAHRQRRSIRRGSDELPPRTPQPAIAPAVRAHHRAVRAGSGERRLRADRNRLDHRHLEQRQARPHHGLGCRQHDLAAAGVYVRFGRRRSLHRQCCRRCLHPAG